MELINTLTKINPILRILLIIVVAAAAHITVKAIRRSSQWLLPMKIDSKTTSEASLKRRYPKLATIITLFACATVIGLAVGFGLQGFVQEFVNRPYADLR